MGKRWLLNAFSLNMFADDVPTCLSLRRLTTDEAAALTESATSAVGHPDTALLFTSILGRTVACNRLNVTLNPEDEAIVGQYVGPRLQPGVAVLPEGARVDWFLVGGNSNVRPP